MTELRVLEESGGMATETSAFAKATADKRTGARIGIVAAVSRSAVHEFTKPNVDSIELIAGLGVYGDAHFGETVQHLVRVREDPTKPNRRQVHLIHGELHDELNAGGFAVGPGGMGENITTRGIDLLGLPLGTRLHIGGDAVVEVTGLRTPCKQIERFQAGLLAAVLQDGYGNLSFKSGIMGVIVKSGLVKAGDAIRVALPPEPHQKLGKV
jgi:MOSC domain-containing protein YiiM